MAMNPTQRRELRGKLFSAQNGKCHWCKTPMQRENVPAIIPDAPQQPANLATFDHLWDRADIRRRQGVPSPIVLACYECNQRRSRETSKRIARMEKAGKRARQQFHHPNTNHIPTP